MSENNARAQMIRRRRESIDMTQEDLARSAGRSKQWVSMVENGTINVKGNSLRLVAKTLGISESVLEAAGHDAPLRPNIQQSVVRFSESLPEKDAARRNEIAIQAMNAIVISNMGETLPDPETVAIRAFEYADALMRRGGVR